MNANFKKWIDTHPAYDIDVLNFGMSMGYDPARILGDIPDWEKYIDLIQKKKGLNREDSTQLVRKLIAMDLETFFDRALGKRA